MMGVHCITPADMFSSSFNVLATITSPSFRYIFWSRPKQAPDGVSATVEYVKQHVVSAHVWDVFVGSSRIIQLLFGTNN